MRMQQAQRDEKKEIVPEQEYWVGAYRWFTYAPEVTGLRLICLEDVETGTVATTMVANDQRRTAAHRAWAGARQSRAAGMPWEILREMGEKGVDPDQKIDEMFRGYGHASVGDMARLAVDMGKIPMHLCLALFNLGALNSGQEKSTRYQPRFGKAVLHQLKNYLPAHPIQQTQLAQADIEALEEEYQSFGTLSLELFAKQREALTRAFAAYYQADMTQPGQKSALTSRVLDCVRYFLLFGQWSGMSFETSARDWSRILAELKASPIPYYHRVAEQIQKLLAPTREEEEILGYKAEAPGLIRHTDPLNTANTNLHELKQFIKGQTDLLQRVTIQRTFRGLVGQRVHMLDARYTAGERLVAQYLLQLWPGLERVALLDWIHGQGDEVKRTISALIFARHSNYSEMPGLARTTNMTLVVESFLGELRDFNRHRAWGRFVPLPLVFGEPLTQDGAQQLLARGFGLPLYLTEVAEFAAQKEEFERDLYAYYAKLRAFLDRVAGRYGATIDYTFMLNLLPLAHQVDIWLHGDPRQALYLTMQRVRPGGHINYRALAYEANQLLAGYDPYLAALRLSARPDATSRTEFFDRS
ncbi:MAG: hypothetical protein PVS3B1_27240 [Ktedonobacteraceae bacterium]